MTFAEVCENPNKLLVHYLMSSYIYYELNDSVYSDHQYDQICRELLNRWDDVDHMHKHLVTKSHLEAGTGYDIKYTNMIKGGAHDWLKRNKISFM